jgi:hypothetical protein
MNQHPKPRPKIEEQCDEHVETDAKDNRVTLGRFKWDERLR